MGFVREPYGEYSAGGLVPLAVKTTHKTAFYEANVHSSSFPLQLEIFS